ncbi:hypothetical protein Barb6XT_00266 [Bacteroidales bacterium Barb6XT]|nr:hypothetical protein Barb6XT_00266 [Bacteroidales bacterium Barb6XT]OAV69941.1 hypothetical protein Barb4_01572 [Bacteroidales bacterium Barb4]
MAVTKIRKISSWTLLLSAVISIAVFVVFAVGGDDELYKNELWNPHYTGLLLNWIYILFGITIAALVVFALMQFATQFKHDTKGALLGLGVLVLFAVMLIVTHSLGSSDLLPIINADSGKHNVPFWLKITDMWIFSIYILTALTIAAVLWSSVKRIFNK